MITLIVRIYSVFLFLALIAAFIMPFSYWYYVRAVNPEVGASVSPFIGGLVGLCIGILVFGAGFVLIGIFENTLTLANSARDSKAAPSSISPPTSSS